MSIQIVSYVKACEILGLRDGSIGAVVSIADSEPYTKQAPYGLSKIDCVLRLVFDDTINPESIYQPPSIEQIGEIIDFAHTIHGCEKPVLFHCEAGISRSSAAAYICNAVWFGEGNERTALDRLYESHVRIAPNSLMVKYADKLLNRKNKLIRALELTEDADVWAIKQKKKRKRKVKK